MAMGLLYGLTLWSNVCLCVGFGSNGFVTKTLSFPMDGHYRMDIISGVGHSRSDSVVLQVLRTVCYVMAGAPALYYGPSRQRQPCLEGVISRIDHIGEL